MKLVWVRLTHTLVFVAVFAAILFLLYCGVVNSITKWTGLALGLVAIEVVIYVGNGFRCPLRTLAETLTPEGQTVSDIYLPLWLSARVVKISVPLLGLACLLLLVRVIT